LENILNEPYPAILVLEDGTSFHGISIGANGESTAEIVFNTAMTGYQEIITDLSYVNQMIAFTCPHIGNTGINTDDLESPHITASALIMRESPWSVPHWRKEKDLSVYLQDENIPAIANIDTRKLTRILREKGVLHACLLAGTLAQKENAVAYALDKARHFSGLNACDLAKTVSRSEIEQWNEKTWCFNEGYSIQKQLKYHVVVYDFGVKKNILRYLSKQGCKLTIVPAQTPSKDVLSMQPDGIFLSNGPGDPSACIYAVDAIQDFLKQKIPLFGICLGHQLLALALGAKTQKMKFGHHGSNHPVQNLLTQSVLITSQNHGFSVDPETLPSNIKITHKSLFDGSLQGFSHQTQPAFGFQGHPEASPGPQDAEALFKHFTQLMDSQREF
jgi:carbamoyl-phosphate synthase small subunit